MTQPEPELAPCPFCGATEGLELVGDSDEPGEENTVHVVCETCFCTGPDALLGCREEEEDGPIDLDAEAREFWNYRALPVTVEQILDLAPGLEKSIAELERTDPAVRKARESLDKVTSQLSQRTAEFMDSLTPKERALVEARFGKEEK